MQVLRQITLLNFMSGQELSPLINKPWEKLFLQPIVAKWCASVWSRSHSSVKWKHSKGLWPYVTVARNSLSAISSVRVTPPNVNFNLTPISSIPIPTAKTGHIILSGPSVNEIDYEKLHLPVLMGVNGAIALCKNSPLNFTHYVITDRYFARDRSQLVEEIVSRDLILFASVYTLKSIAHYVDIREIKCKIVVIEEVDRPPYLPCPSVQQLQKKAREHPDFTIFDVDRCFGFSLNPALGLFSACTVAYVALQLMAWFGMENIYFHGLDMNNLNLIPRFYETKENMLRTRLHEHFPNIIRPCFKYASEHLRNKGINVYNLSINSALDEDVFPKVDWRVLR